MYSKDSTINTGEMLISSANSSKRRHCWSAQGSRTGKRSAAGPGKHIRACNDKDTRVYSSTVRFSSGRANAIPFVKANTVPVGRRTSGVYRNGIRLGAECFESLSR
jgi:hypothetical protein